jgi:hypothetical protein
MRIFFTEKAQFGGIALQKFRSEEISELATALISVQRSLQPAFKDAENPFVHNRYATLKSVMETCREALLSNNIWMTQFPVPADPGYLGLVTKLTHADSGQWQSSLAIVPLPKADPQGMGSAMTYARRYALSAMLGIITDDDDGEGANLPEKGPLPQTDAGSMHGKPLSHALTDTPTGVQKYSTLESPPRKAPVTDLPRIDGITYQRVVTPDGRPCVVALGNTASKKELLAGAGFKWNPKRKTWWMYADVS